MWNNKVKTFHELRSIVLDSKSRGEKVVFANGCFDILHCGHLQYLEESKSQGDILVVAINSDSSVKAIKGNGRPIIDEKDRARLVAGLECVDYVIIFGEETPLRLIEKLKPDILVKSSDWKIHRIVGRKIAKKVVRIKLLKGYSTSRIIENVKNHY